MSPSGPRSSPGRRLAVNPVLLLILLGAVAFLVFGPTAIRQARNLRAAQDHLPTINRAIAEFRIQDLGVKASVYTGEGGSILIRGTVASAEDLSKLKRMVEATQPPVMVLFRVNLEDPDFRETSPEYESTSAIRQESPPTFPDRHEFASRMTRVTELMPAKEVEAILGRPDDIRSHHDPGGITTTRTREIWCYGTNGHLTFPTLGRVYIDDNGLAQYVYGQGAPPTAKGADEGALRALLRVIDRAPRISGWEYNPLRVIEVVNALQPLGKEKALEAIDEYLRVASHFHSDAASDGLFLVLRVLFEVPADPGYMPRMCLGMPAGDPEPDDRKLLPRYPLHIEGDIPLLLINGYLLGGVPEPVRDHVAYFRRKGTLRARPLSPSADPLGALERSRVAMALIHPPGDSWQDHHRGMVRNQLLHLVDTVYRIDKKGSGPAFDPGDGADGRWKKIEDEVSSLGIRWDSTKGRYTFKDGTSLPDRPVRIYRREIWKMDGLDKQATLVFERIDAGHVSVVLTREGKGRRPATNWSVRVFASKSKEKSLVEFPLKGRSGPDSDDSMDGSWSKGEGSDFEIPEGEEIQVELKVGGKTSLSPVYKP